MKLKDIFQSEESTSAEKVKAISEVVTKARAKYGNADLDITAPEVHTVDGLQDLKMLCNDSKVAIAASEVTNITTVAVEYCKAMEGTILDVKLAELIAISPILVNLTEEVDSQFI